MVYNLSCQLDEVYLPLQESNYNQQIIIFDDPRNWIAVNHNEMVWNIKSAP